MWEMRTVNRGIKRLLLVFCSETRLYFNVKMLHKYVHTYIIDSNHDSVIVYNKRVTCP